MNNKGTLYLDALKKKYEAQIAEHTANLVTYFEGAVGVGEHPGIVRAMDSEVSKLAEAIGKYEALTNIFKQEEQEQPETKDGE